MTRVLLFHWKTEEAQQRLQWLRDAGYAAEHRVCRSGADLIALRDDVPDAFVIDLSRVPSQGREVGSMLRRQKATRQVPLVFVAGEAAKVARVRDLLPDAVYAEWSDIGSAIGEALRARTARPVVRDAMAGYSGTPLAKKLGVRAKSTLLLSGAPPDFAQMLAPLPEGVRLKDGLRETAKLIVLFAKSRTGLERRFSAAVRVLEDRGSIWIAWPKKASGIASDLSEATVRQFGLAAGFVDYKICAIDKTWSGLLFTRRRS